MCPHFLRVGYSVTYLSLDHGSKGHGLLQWSRIGGTWYRSPTRSRQRFRRNDGDGDTKWEFFEQEIPYSSSEMSPSHTTPLALAAAAAAAASHLSASFESAAA